MNIVFWLGALLMLTLFWFESHTIFEPIGNVLVNLFNDVKKEIMNDEKENETNEN